MASKQYNAQLEVLVADTPLKDMQTADLTSLLTLELNYSQRIVWVLSEQTYYYLQSGDGTQLTHWKKHETLNSKIPAYDSLLSYTTDDAVWIGGSVYVALGSVNPGQDPPNNPTLWQQVTGGNATQYKFTFTDADAVNITSPKVNAHIQVYVDDVQCLCAIEKSSNTEYLITFKNEESGYVIV